MLVENDAQIAAAVEAQASAAEHFIGGKTVRCIHMN